MLSIGLSLNSGIKLLERTLKFRVASIFQDASQPYAQATEVATTKAVALDRNIGLRIAKTTLPEERMDFNQTFFHIRQELDEFYKERNPIFNNTADAALLQAQSHRAN